MGGPAGLLVPLTLFSVMLALGVGLPLEALRNWKSHWPLILRAQLASCLLVPLLGGLLLLSPISQGASIEARHAIALMAACPSAPLILRKAGKTGQDAGLAGLLQVTAAVVAIISLPLLADLATQLFPVKGWDVKPMEVAQQVGQGQILPLLLGLGLRRLWPGPMARLSRPLNRLANGLLLLLVAAVLWRAAPLLIRFGTANLEALALMLLLVLASLGIGFGAAGGPRSQRSTTALVTSMRNPGLALLLAGTYAPALPEVRLGIITYVLVTLVVLALAGPVLQGKGEVTH
jgi:predicted Na+-dependent transporter